MPERQVDAAELAKSNRDFITDNAVLQPRMDENKATRESEFKLGGEVDTSEDRIYIPLDTLLDVRLACIAQQDQELATKVLKKKWGSRIKDESAGLITAEQLAKWYDSRDMETLKYSVVTNMSFFLKRIVKDNIIHTVHTNTNDKIVFEINVWPYKDIDEAFVDMLIECVRFHTYSTATVTVIDAPLEKLPPDYMCDRYKVAVFYTEWLDWVAAHKKFFEKRGIPELAIVAPAILHKDCDYTEMKAMGVNPGMVFSEMEKTFKPMFNLKLYPSSLYSVSESINQETAAEAVEIVSVTTQDIEQHILKNDPTAEIVDVPINRELPLDLSRDPSDSKEVDKDFDPFNCYAD